LQISDVAWAPMALRIPIWMLSLRARNASVVSVSDVSGGGQRVLTTLVLDDNALAPSQQDFSIGSILTLTDTLQVFSCERCGLRVGVAQLIPGTSSSTVKALQEMRVAEVRHRCTRAARSRLAIPMRAVVQVGLGQRAD